MAYVITSSERAWFERCRRAWDLGASARRNLEPARAQARSSLGRAIRDALAVYYFPGMWDWDRRIVLPLALRAFEEGMGKHRGAPDREEPLSSDGEAEWRRQLDLGKRMLTNYFAWAPEVDGFCPVRVEADFEVNVPDPARPGRALTTPSGEEVRYRDRIDMLIVDRYDVYWVIEHRVVEDLEDVDTLVLDDLGVSHCWAWPQFYLGMNVAGTIYNELRTQAPDAAPPPERPATSAPIVRVPQHQRRLTHHRRMYAKAARQPDQRIEQQGTEFLRRTCIPRTTAQVEGFGRRLATEALEMMDPSLQPYPSPSPDHCPRCRFLAPCIAMERGEDASAILATGYRQRLAQPVEEGRLGGVTWGMGRGATPPSWWRTEERG